MGVDLDGASVFVVPGRVWAKAGAVLNSRIRGYASELALRSGQAIVITSGIRTPAAQAAAMAEKVRLGGIAQLHATYRSDHLVDEIVRNGTGVSSMAAAIQAQMDRGVYLSNHLRADALDVRVRGYTPAEEAVVLETARRMGGNVVKEGTPPHIHVGGIGATFAARDPWAWGALGAAGAAYWALTS